MKKVLIYLSIILVSFSSKAQALFDQDKLYFISCYDTQAGGIEPASTGDYPLIYNVSVTENSSKALWIIQEEETDKYSIKNSVTGQYIEYVPTATTAKYVAMTNQLKGDYTLFSIGKVKAENGITYWYIQPVSNPEMVFDRRSYNAVGPYSAKYTNNQLFSFKEKGGGFVEPPVISGDLSKYLNSFTFNEMNLAYDGRSGSCFFSVALEEMNTDISRTVNFIPKKEEYTVLIDGKAISDGGQHTFKNITANKEYSIQIQENGKIICTQKVIFTGMPIVQLYSEGNNLSTTFSRGKIRIYEGEKELSGELINAEIRYRGATATGYNKKAFAIKLRNDNWESIDRSFFGLRNDNYWILDAMAMDRSRMRNRVSTDIWNDFSASPYYKSQEPEMVNATRGHYVEVFLDNEYWGLYCMTERIDRKQLKLKKYLDETESVRGVLYKTPGWSYEVLMGSPYGWKPAGSTLESYDNLSEIWANYEVKYPELEDAQKIDWEPIYDIVNLAATGNDLLFRTYISQDIDFPVWLDYYLLMELILATDNHGKNAYYYMYNINNERKLGIAPWDMDGVLGIRWDRSRLDPDWDYTTFIKQKEHGENNLYRRLKALNVSKFNELLKQRYNELRFSHFTKERLIGRLETYMNMFWDTGAAYREIERWNGADRTDLDFDDEIQYLTNWLSSRIDYLDQRYGPLEPPTGIEQMENRLSVYPNPVIETLYVSDITPGTSVWVYSETGICLFNSVVKDSSISIDFATYSSGRYYLKIGKMGKVIIKK